MPRIRSVSTALPPHKVDQAFAREGCRRLLGDSVMIRVFDHAGVDTRYFVNPPDYYLDGRTFEQRNLDYVQQAVLLGERAARGALEGAGLGPADVGHFYFVTTTGLATPSVDARLVNRMGLRRDIMRNPLFGIGCAGGAAALARAAEFLRGHPRERALVLSVELCGQTFRSRDRSPVNYVGAALFGDGAAAAILEGDEVASAGPDVVACGRELFEGTETLMGWEFLNDGLKLVLSVDLPRVVGERIVPAIDRFLSENGVSRKDIRHYVLHPGGRRILEMYQERLGVSDSQLAPTKESLRNVGNLSSAAVLFVLSTVQGGPGEHGLLLSVGPGFGIELVLLRW